MKAITSSSLGLLDIRYVNVIGDTMTGDLTLSEANLIVNGTDSADGVSSSGKYGGYFEQDALAGYGLYSYRNLTEASYRPLVVFFLDNANDGGPVLSLWTQGTGPHITTEGSNQDLILSPHGTGAVIVKSSTNSTTAFQVNQSNGTNVLNVDTTNGRVGIGTTGPVSLLHLQSTTPWLYIHHNSPTIGDEIGIDFGATGTHKIARITAVGTLNYGGNLHFETSVNDGAYQKRLTILEGGNVGIGTPTPRAKLEIVGGDIWHFSNGGNPRHVLGDSNTGGNWGSIRWNSSGDRIELGTEAGGVDTLVIDENGNVGIGTTSPDTKLQVVGDTKLGDDNTNYATFATDGELTLVGTARVLRSVDFEPDAVKKGGVGPTDSTEDGFPIHDYQSTNDESVFVHWEIPHDYADGQEIHLHVEFFVDTAPASAKSVTWGVEYKKQSTGDNFSFGGSTTVITNTSITTGTPANDKKIHISALIQLTTTGFEPMDVVLIRIFRDADASEDGATDDFGSNARVFNYHLMYLSDKLGQAS